MSIFFLSNGISNSNLVEFGYAVGPSTLPSIPSQEHFEESRKLLGIRNPSMFSAG